jgi:hypothetical protein
MNRIVTASLAFVGLLIVAGCGESGLTGGDDLGGGNDLTASADDMRPPDLATPRDMTYVLRQDGGPVQCGNMTCGGATKCCIETRLDGGNAGQTYCAATCNQGSISVECRNPSQCGGNPCCVQLQGQNIRDVQCEDMITDCFPQFDFNTFSGQTRLCEFDADCTAGAPSTQLNRCCEVMQQGQRQKLCLSTSLAAFAQANCN